MSCISQKDNQTSTIYEVIFNAQSRGALENISLTNNTITYKNYNTTKTYKISKNNLEQLFNLIQKLDLKTISEIQAPSNKRATDAALHASLTIKTSNESFTSNVFDDDNPPSELKDIIDLLKTFSQE
ncbi:hypothetical protein [uncultured Tenacibaculum sp.]|uniref:hypothetical protein n=1 Tax=uncultured Tenacibaculum sp. TaxID=174713 RepID=UPI002627B451|nr:hypothetical protein [uncultured Tenacibaculum sp.]